MAGSTNTETMVERVRRVLAGLADGEEAELDLYLIRKRKNASVRSTRCTISRVADRMGVNYYTRMDDGRFYLGRLE